MRLARTLEELEDARTALARGGRPLGLVPTMGALHAGHLALIAAARQRGTAVAASIFVNPTQFTSTADLAFYPRDEPGDLAALEGAGCELAWLPAVETMYPPSSATTIDIAGPALLWEGVARPGHFRGVATVVTTLFGQLRPEAAFFGEKDWQQLQVIRRLVSDLCLRVEIVAVPTVRAPDGLALSSRNRFLSPAERLRAPQLYETLRALASILRQGEPAAGPIDRALAKLRATGFQPDYLALVHAETLEPLTRAEPPARLLAAAALASVRLLDNIAVV